MRRSEIKSGMELRVLKGKRESEIGKVNFVSMGQVDVEFSDGVVRYYGYGDVEPAGALDGRVKTAILREQIDIIARNILKVSSIDEKVLFVEELKVLVSETY